MFWILTAVYLAMYITPRKSTPAFIRHGMRQILEQYEVYNDVEEVTPRLFHNEVLPSSIISDSLDG